nr:hypothetical protein [Jiangella gansuensis]
MSMTHRLQILLDEERHRRVIAVAASRHVSVATVIREAIDRGLPTTGRPREEAASRFLAAEPMDVPEVDELLDELDQLRGRRG